MLLANVVDPEFATPQLACLSGVLNHKYKKANHGSRGQVRMLATVIYLEGTKYLGLTVHAAGFRRFGQLGPSLRNVRRIAE